MLYASPGLRPIAKFEEVVRRHPELGTGVRRTLERRIRTWRAVNGPERRAMTVKARRALGDLFTGPYGLL